MDQQVVWDRSFGDSRSWLDLGKPDWPRSGWSLARGSTRSGSGRRGLDQADKGHSVGGVEGSGKGKRSRLGFAKLQRDWVGGSCRRARVVPIGRNRNWLGARFGPGYKNSLLGQGGGLGKVP